MKLSSAMYISAACSLIIIACAVFNIALVVTRANAADTGACYAIGDADARQMCIARARADASQCYAIQRTDMRAQCLAEVRK